MDVFVARQPIFDHRQEVSAYELLFRSAKENRATLRDAEATYSVMANSLMTIGLDHLVGGHQAFLNFTRANLLGDIVRLMTPEQVVIEVLEDVEVDDQVIAACRSLRDAGYSLALDDVISEHDKHRPLLEFAKIIKVDWLAAPLAVKRTLPRRWGGRGLQFLAEKIETHADFRQAVGWGYTLLQGYFFSKPEMIAGRELPGSKLTYLRVMQKVLSPWLDYDDLAETIRSDVSLSYKLLRYINSPTFGWRRRIESIRHALVAIGEAQVRRWVSLVAMSCMGRDKPNALVGQSVLRAHFCDGLARELALDPKDGDAFLVGLFSLLDAIMDRPLSQVIGEIGLRDVEADALLSDLGAMGKLLRVVKAYERADWDGLEAETAGLPLEEDCLGQLYCAALQTTEELFGEVTPVAEAAA